MVITKEVLDRFFEEQESKSRYLNSFFEEASPFVCVAVKKTADLFLKEAQFRTVYDCLSYSLSPLLQAEKQIYKRVGRK